MKQTHNHKPCTPSLFAWYDDNRRVLPWRARAGQTPNPYHVWLSEIMLQQTTVAVVEPYFMRFIRKWPTVKALAKADLDEVLQLWAGLGYYRRAQGLHQTARIIVAEYGGVFPKNEKQLRALPGVGDYTAAAIMSIAFNKRANVVDGNVERVMARLFAIAEPLPQAKKTLKALALRCLPKARFGDYAQALMDLGATVCTPRKPDCAHCPWRKACRARAMGVPENYPYRVKGKKKPARKAFAFIALDERGRILLEKRHDKGLLAGMMGVPVTPLDLLKPLAWNKALTYAPPVKRWKKLPESVYHSFTHFDLEVCVAIGTIAEPYKGRWIEPVDLPKQALPSVMRKVLKTALTYLEE